MAMPSCEPELVLLLSLFLLLILDIFHGKHEVLCSNAYMHKLKQFIVTYFYLLVAVKASNCTSNAPYFCLRRLEYITPGKINITKFVLVRS